MAPARQARGPGDRELAAPGRSESDRPAGSLRSPQFQHVRHWPLASQCVRIRAPVQLNTSKRELTLKVVYYGPALSGKTTNLQALFGMLDVTHRGDLTTLDTKGDRTLFFDLLPVHFRTRSGMKVKVKLFTVPGQVVHESTRRIVLSGTDAVVFVADSQRKGVQANNDSFENMQRNLRANNLDPDRIPAVIQFNKRDLPDVLSDEELIEMSKRGKEPVFSAVALTGQGVVETLKGVMLILYRSLDAEHDFGRKFGISEREFIHNVFEKLEAARAAESSR
ncbi:MAG: GTPase domain-containing protein [Deltaproteobacteria bacterium]|nr:GTPase domain-containing protein [Deltaproteobacteria bacterium]